MIPETTLCSADPPFENIAVIRSPAKNTTETITRLMPPAINAYSIAVAARVQDIHEKSVRFIDLVYHKNLSGAKARSESPERLDGLQSIISARTSPQARLDRMPWDA